MYDSGEVTTSFSSNKFEKVFFLVDHELLQPFPKMRVYYDQKIIMKQQYHEYLSIFKCFVNINLVKTVVIWKL